MRARVDVRHQLRLAGDFDMKADSLLRIVSFLACLRRSSRCALRCFRSAATGNRCNGDGQTGHGEPNVVLGAAVDETVGLETAKRVSQFGSGATDAIEQTLGVSSGAATSEPKQRAQNRMFVVHDDLQAPTLKGP
jgi:hypothetical protein